MGTPLLIDASCFKYWAYALLLGGYIVILVIHDITDLLMVKTLCYL